LVSYYNNLTKLLNYFLERAKRVVIIKGNHDNILEPILRGKKNVKLVARYVLWDCCFIHGDSNFKEIWQKKIK
jgi:metallophosphoesterase superfamily enzyme